MELDVDVSTADLWRVGCPLVKNRIDIQFFLVSNSYLGHLSPVRATCHVVTLATTNAVRLSTQFPSDWTRRAYCTGYRPC
jgi:hypothetical protein